MKQKSKVRRAEPFSETSLTILVSLVTLALQIISFATTWSGSRIYLEGVFPGASLLFAAAVQATAWFFSNSLRDRLSVLRTAALLIALCCSTYYSYIGIYNSVNSPVSYLQERYLEVQEELTLCYGAALEANLAQTQEAVNSAASLVTARYTALTGEQENMAACRDALREERESHVSGMQAPRLSAYEDYETYAAAYSAYLAGASAGSTAEDEAFRNGALAAYGFTSVSELAAAEQENAAALGALNAALGVRESDGTSSAGGDAPAAASDMSAKLYLALEEAALGQEPDSADSVRLNRLFRAAQLCGYEGMGAAQVQDAAGRLAKVAGEPLLADYADLVGALEDERVTDANTVELKAGMDSEILGALLKVNSLLPEEEKLSLADERFAITDLYLLPVHALTDSGTRLTAAFCLGMAALIDLLTLLFAVSLRRRKPLWKRHSLLLTGMEDYAPHIYALLPAGEMQTAETGSVPAQNGPAGDAPCAEGREADGRSRARALANFLGRFAPSPETEQDGYMMKAGMEKLKGFEALAALLCQVNLARLVPAGFLEGEGQQLLLRAKFVFWADEAIREEAGEVEIGEVSV